jgi:hypothetical protein
MLGTLLWRFSIINPYEAAAFYTGGLGGEIQKKMTGWVAIEEFQCLWVDDNPTRVSPEVSPGRTTQKLQIVRHPFKAEEGNPWLSVAQNVAVCKS